MRWVVRGSGIDWVSLLWWLRWFGFHPVGFVLSDILLFGILFLLKVSEIPFVGMLVKSRYFGVLGIAVGYSM